MDTHTSSQLRTRLSNLRCRLYEEITRFKPATGTSFSRLWVPRHHRCSQANPRTQARPPWCGESGRAILSEIEGSRALFLYVRCIPPSPAVSPPHRSYRQNKATGHCEGNSPNLLRGGLKGNEQMPPPRGSFPWTSAQPCSAPRSGIRSRPRQ